MAKTKELEAPKQRKQRPKGSTGAKKTMRTKEELAILETEMVKLRIEGHSFSAIARQYGYADPTYPHKVVQRAVTRHRTDAVKEYQDLEMARLDKLLSHYFPLALNKRGNDGAANTVLKIINQQCKILGLHYKDAVDNRVEQLSQEHAKQLAQVMSAVMDDMDLSDEQQTRMPDVVRKHVMPLLAANQDSIAG